MLYVSRFVDSMRFGVVDTDDNTETPVHRQELDQAVLVHKLDIKGVYIGEGYGSRYVKAVIPYQDPSRCTPLQVKTKTMLGVDVRIYEDEITAIIPNLEAVQGREVSIRLSKYAKKLGWYPKIHWKPRPDNKWLILVLDDKLAIRDTNLEMNITRVKWDIRDVHNEAFIRFVYDKLSSEPKLHSDDWGKCVIDTEERMRSWRGY